MGGKTGQEALVKAKERPGEILAPVPEEQLIRREVPGEEQLRGNPASAVVQRTVTAAGPQIPHEAPPGKFSHRQVLGKLDEKERIGTHSDEQRMGVKQYLLDNVALDEKKKCSKQFRHILELIREYACINVTGDGDKKILMKESSLLMKVMKEISSRAQELRQEGVRRKNEMEELELLTIYEEYFKMDTGGYLEVPPGGEIIDYGERELTGTYKNSKKQKIPIVLKEVPREEPLFPHEPSVNDIVQGRLGDCYLLSGLASIVHASPQMIKDCMRDNGDGTVTVRFYKNAEDWNQPMRPVYVRVKKSVPEGDVYARGSLWVQMMEKAYAASGLHSSQEPSYNAIEGGTADKFISRLTGKKAVRMLSPKSIQESDNYFAAMFISLWEKNAAEKKFPNLAALQAAILGIPVSEEMTIDEGVLVCTAVSEYIDYFEKVKREKISSPEQEREFFEHLKAEDLPDIIPEEEQNSEAQKEKNRAMKETAARQIRDFMLSILPHQAFSGAYTAHAEELYAEIQESVRRGERVTASSETTFKRGAATGLNGEGMELGIAAKHAYTVMGVKQLGENKYIQLRNPWAYMVRTYERDTESRRVTGNAQREGNHGIFLMELNDFVNYYRMVRIS